MSAFCVKWMIPSCRALSPERIGSHDPAIMCHSTGIDVSPKVTAQRAIPYTGIGSLLYGLILMDDGTILSSKFYF